MANCLPLIITEVPKSISLAGNTTTPNCLMRQSGVWTLCRPAKTCSERVGTWVFPLVSAQAANGRSPGYGVHRRWSQSQAAMTDYRSWSPHVVVGGILAIHDIFPDPQTVDRPPDIYRLALASGLFEEVEMRRTLAILRRLRSRPARRF